eukprot:CAMPEP_0205907146 /NCGR_PEP_ID=MMETSP1325-20131115/2357_1 /ASSEMBLY_ACC=CAM_ASM_000708 /TAXON_ID=236786 /ORGANISM="Florenciella sp., Strain RCC1007" /LENGTH=71 /DNA_ID=CAMNT_0053273211 /DNA_START=288 /DNA_END=500 /DNA_ORIENTATION=+
MARREDARIVLELASSRLRDRAALPPGPSLCTALAAEPPATACVVVNERLVSSVSPTSSGPSASAAAAADP